MNHFKSILIAALVSLTGASFAQIVDASPETQTICSGGSATLTAVVTGGAAGGGGVATNTYTVSSIPYAPNPYGAGTAIPSSDDTQHGPFCIGFDFNFFGTNYTQFYVGSNGWVAFSPQPTTFTSALIPNAGGTIPKNCIMGPWQDWLPGAAHIRYQTTGVAPNRKLVVSWNNCPMFSCTANLGTFQIVLNEGSNIVENFIQTKPTCAWAGGTAVLGVHNPAGTVAYTVPGRNSTVWTATNEGWRYSPAGPGTIPPVASTFTISWFVLPSNTLVGTGSPITVTPPAGAPSTSYYASISGTGACGVPFASRDTVVVLQTIVPPLTAGNNGPICAGTPLNLTASPAIPGATYSWTGPGGFTSTLQNPTIASSAVANSGVYTVTPTLAGCVGAPASTTVTVNAVPATPAITGTTPICSGTTLSLSTTSPGPSWNWIGPSGFTSTVQNPSIPSATTGASGVYSVTATSAAGCVSTPGTINITVNATPVAPTVANVSICYGMSASLTASGSGATYEWFDVPGGTLLATGATYNTPPITATTNYSVQSTTLGCTGPMTTVTVTVAPSLTPDAGVNDSVCSGGIYGLVAIPTGAGYTYSWDAPGNPGFSTSSSPAVIPATTTTYTVTVTDAFGCTGTDAVTITTTTPLVVNTNVIPANCFAACNGSGSVSATGSYGGYAYSWSTGSAATVISSLCAATYTVTVTDLFGCTASNTITVTEPADIILSTSAVTSNCNLPDGSASVTASGGMGGFTYLWSNGQTTATATALIPGSYCVTVTDLNGCSKNVCVTVPNAPGVSATMASTVISCNGACDGTATVTGTSGVTPYTYLWAPGGQTTAGITGLCPGTYTCTITDASGCTSSATATITEPALVVIGPITSVAICTGQSTTLTATATGGHPIGGYTFNWMAPAFTGSSYVVTPAATTTYTVIANDNVGCVSVPVTVTVTVRPPLGVVAGPDVNICPGGSTTLTSVASGGNSSYVYSWMPGSGTGSSFTVSPAVTTTYTITITDGCTTTPATDVVTVTVLPTPVVSFSSDVNGLCEPMCVTFTDASTVAGGTITGWLWDFGDGVNTSTLQTPVPVCYFANGIGYDVTLTVTSNGGCTATSTISDMVNAYPVPVAEFAFGPQPTTMEDPTINFVDLSVDAVNWSWDFGDPTNTNDLNTSSLINPQHTYADSGTYCVTLTVQSPGGCADSETKCLKIDPEYTFYIPSGFTPNNDGHNPIFAPKGQTIDEFTMRIYNRWGNLIFLSGSYNQGWDGRLKDGSIAMQDTYVYTIDIKDKNGNRHNYKGTVTIVK